MIRLTMTVEVPEHGADRAEDLLRRIMAGPALGQRVTITRERVELTPEEMTRAMLCDPLPGVRRG
jgi:hypothetical protein